MFLFPEGAITPSRAQEGSHGLSFPRQSGGYSGDSLSRPPVEASKSGLVAVTSSEILFVS